MPFLLKAKIEVILPVNGGYPHVIPLTHLTSAIVRSGQFAQGRKALIKAHHQTLRILVTDELVSMNKIEASLSLGDFQIGLESLIKLRQGSELSLPLLPSLEGTLLVEGLPFASAIVTARGEELVVSIKEIFHLNESEKETYALKPR